LTCVGDRVYQTRPALSLLDSASTVRNFNRTSYFLNSTVTILHLFSNPSTTFFSTPKTSKTVGSLSNGFYKSLCR